MDRLKIANIDFVGEQDGAVERELKKRLTACLTGEFAIKEAFLVRVTYPGSKEQKVSLCLGGGEIDAKPIVDSVGEIFRQMFKTTESLDVIFLKKDQRAKVIAVASPFFERT